MVHSNSRRKEFDKTRLVNSSLNTIETRIDIAVDEEVGNRIQRYTWYYTIVQIWRFAAKQPVTR